MAVVFDNAAFLAGVVIAACALILVGLRVVTTRLGDRQLGGPGQTRLFREGARTGIVPSGADHLVWREVLERMVARRARRGQVPPHVRAAIFGVIVAVVLVLWTPLLLAVAIGAVVVATSIFMDRRVRRREIRLLATLRQMG